jgi:hypothetical protein
MQYSYWSAWESFLTRKNLKTAALALLRDASGLLPLAAMGMAVGMPIFKGFSWGKGYTAFIETYSDEDSIRAFADFLEGVS